MNLFSGVAILFLFLCESYCFFNGVVFASDSTTMQPVATMPGKSFGFVLAKGDSEGLFCREGVMKNNCILDISDHLCPVGFTPKVHVAPVGNQFNKWRDCSLRGYFLKHSVPLINQKGGYTIRFYNAYARFTTFLCEDHAIDISYAVYCV